MPDGEARQNRCLGAIGLSAVKRVLWIDARVAGAEVLGIPVGSVEALPIQEVPLIVRGYSFLIQTTNERVAPR